MTEHACLQRCSVMPVYKLFTSKFGCVCVSLSVCFLATGFRSLPHFMCLEKHSNSGENNFMGYLNYQFPFQHSTQTCWVFVKISVSVFKTHLNSAERLKYILCCRWRIVLEHLERAAISFMKTRASAPMHN